MLKTKALTDTQRAATIHPVLPAGPTYSEKVVLDFRVALGAKTDGKRRVQLARNKFASTGTGKGAARSTRAGATEGTKKAEKRDFHAKVSENAFRQFKSKCALIDIEMGAATELLWQLWFEGKVAINKPSATVTTTTVTTSATHAGQEDV